MSWIEQFRSSSPTRQLTLVLAAVILIGAVLSAAYFLILRRPYAVLYANLRSADAATTIGTVQSNSRLKPRATQVFRPDH